MKDPETRIIGGREAIQVRDNPPRPPTPNKPARPGGVASPFPVIPQSELHQYKIEPKRAEDPVANNRPGAYDPELNEMALRDIAAERGITVEQLLASQPDRKLERKVQRMEQNMTPEQLVALQAEAERMASPEPALDSADRIAFLEAQLARAKAEVLKTEAAALPPAPAAKPFLTPPTPPPTKTIDTPILRRMREKLSLERLQPEEVTIEEIRFGLLPPPASMHPWVWGKLLEAQSFGQHAFDVAFSNSTAAACTVLVEGLPLVEALGLVPEGTFRDFRTVPSEQREIAAQAFFEVLNGSPTIESLKGFQANPDLGKKLAQAFNAKFKGIELHSSMDPKLRTFTCPMEGCAEQFDRKVEAGVPVFCMVHAVPMDDRGLTAEVRRGPLP